MNTLKEKLPNIYKKCLRLIFRYFQKPADEIYPVRSTFNFIEGEENYIQSLFKEV